MKVTIEITTTEASITLHDGDKKHVRTWERTDYGCTTTDDSVDFEALDINDELADALEGLDVYDVMKHLETEEYDTPDQVVITREGNVLKKGDKFFGIGISKNGYVPFKCTFPQDFYSIGDEENIYSQFGNARDYCVERNNRESSQLKS